MQLAATQRPHPPPVPPRPSRQVVAEALKRSPRPPCPTRQAPPPPNTKPWRSDRDRANNRQQVYPAPVGRTLVYESSIKESLLPKETSNESGGDCDSPLDKNREPVSRAASERRADEDDWTRGNPRERRHRVPDQEHRPNSTTESSPNTDATAAAASSSSPLPREKEDRSSPCHSVSLLEHAPSKERSFNGATTSGERSPVSEKSISNVDRTSTGTSEKARIESESIISRAKETTVCDNDAKITGLESRVSLDEVQCCHISPDVSESKKSGERGGPSFSERNQCSERSKADGSTRLPTPSQRSCLVKYRDSARKNAESSTAIQSSVSNVDRATVVVIDESDRKAASNDHPDHCDDRNHHVNQHNNNNNKENAENDNDNDNIHRQDWLEAGVHYSSTQIRLSGEDGDVIDGSRVNGFDRCENEKFGDFNVPR